MFDISGESPPVRVVVRHDGDVLLACQKARTLAAAVGFSVRDQAAIAIATTEIGQNIVRYAGRGEIIVAFTDEGIVIMAMDNGPGIANVELAMQNGYSTSGGLGMGLPGAKRLMDVFEIMSEMGKGTIVIMRKWKRYD